MWGWQTTWNFGRQFLNSEVQNTNVFHSRVSRRHRRAVLLLFFASIRAFAFFSFQGQNNVISLMDGHVQHLASLCRICGDKIKDHMRKVDFITNRFVSEVHQIWKDLLLLDSPNVHPQ